MTYNILQGDCMDTLKTLEAGSVQTCVTSPPYFGLRNYNGGDAEIGTEETPDAYVAKLVDVFREVKRVLRDDGTLWLNLACSYNGSGGAGGDYGVGGLKEGQPKYLGRNLSNFKPKDMIPIPWMVAMALQQDGYYLRSDIIWAKPNPMPESVTDRPTKAHEYIFLLSKSASYYYDADAVREETARPDMIGKSNGHWGNPDKGGRALAVGRVASGNEGANAQVLGYTHRNRRSVWTVATKPYSGAHFATFPTDLIEPCILAGTSAKGCCAECGAPWGRVVERASAPKEVYTNSRKPESINAIGSGKVGMGQKYQEWLNENPPQTTGWQPTCTCNADIVPCTVLDPFMGSGTTLAVALRHGRNGIGLELNPDYIELAHKRICESQPSFLQEIL